MTAEQHRSQLRVFRDGRFVEDEPPAAPAPLLAPDSVASRVVGFGCLAAIVLPLLLVALVTGLLALAALADEERISTTGTVLSVGPGTDDDGVPRSHCYEVAYAVEGRDLVHRTCELLPAAVVDLPDETRSERDARFAAVHPVGSEVRLQHAAEPPYAGSGAIADPDVTLVEPGPAGVVLALVAASALSVAGLALWLALRGRRRPAA